MRRIHHLETAEHGLYGLGSVAQLFDGHKVELREALQLCSEENCSIHSY